MEGNRAHFFHEVLKFATNLDEFRGVIARNLNKTLEWNEMF
jgi:hypothetical protein